MTSRKNVFLAAVLIVIIAVGLAGGMFVLKSGNKIALGPAEEYARQKSLSTDTNLSSLDESWSSDNGTKEKAILDYDSTLNGTYQQEFLKDILTANDTTAEYNQVQFLSSLSAVDQFKIINGRNSANFDFNGDGMNNYFEYNIADLPYADHPTVRYAIVVDTHNEQTSGDNLANFLIKQEKFEPNNVIKLVGNDATKENFVQAVSNISLKAG